MFLIGEIGLGFSSGSVQNSRPFPLHGEKAWLIYESNWGVNWLVLLFIRFRQQIAQAIEPSFPGRTTILNPALQGRETCGFEAAGPDSAGFFAADQSAFFEQLQMLSHGGERDVQGGC
jgi:hypothetical protein